MTQTATATLIARPFGLYSPAVEQVAGPGLFAQFYVADLASVFFNADEFAESAMIYHSVAKSWQTYSVLFDDPKTSVRYGGDGSVTEIKPQIQVAESALLYPVQKADRLTVRGVAYVVEDVEPDGVGVVTVFMRRR